MWVWPAIGFAWGFALAIVLGPLLAVFGIVGALVLADQEHRAETVVGTALGTALGLGVLIMLSGMGSTPLADFRLGP